MEKKPNHLSLLLSHYINIDTTGSCCCFWTLEKDRAADGSPCEGPLAMRGIFMRRARIYRVIKPCEIFRMKRKGQVSFRNVCFKWFISVCKSMSTYVNNLCLYTANLFPYELWCLRGQQEEGMTSWEQRTGEGNPPESWEFSVGQFRVHGYHTKYTCILYVDEEQLKIEM